MKNRGRGATMIYCILFVLSGFCNFQVVEAEVVGSFLSFCQKQDNIIAPKDSGQMIDGVKQGKWVEFELDKGQITPELKRMVEEQGLNINDFVTLRKETGSYINGKKNGVWTMHKAEGNGDSRRWLREKETEYKDDKKNGKEFVYSNLGGANGRPLMERSWLNGTEHGVGKIYDINPPYKLEKVYKAIEGKFLLLETYYPGGKLETKFVDTVLNSKPIKYFEHFHENGKLKQTGYYEKDTLQFGEWRSYYEQGAVESIEVYRDGVIDGEYQYFHDNGQLWTKTIYKNGLLWEVLANYDKQGNEKDRGTLKKGTGLVNIYDENGTLSKVVEYKDGRAVK